MFLPFGIERQALKFPGSAVAPDCRRFTPWKATALMCSSLPTRGTPFPPHGRPNGQFLVFAWMRHYGPGAPGAQDLYIMDVASKQWVQLTHDGGRNDFPSWAPDGRHIVFAIQPLGKRRDLEHAGRWYESETVNVFRKKQPTELELEVEESLEKLGNFVIAVNEICGDFQSTRLLELLNYKMRLILGRRK